LNEVSHYLCPEIKVRRGDVLAAWSGIRPLVRNPNAANTAELVRNHLIHVSPSGLLTVAGGKWTTYRKMAEEAVDQAITSFGRASSPTFHHADLKPRTPCRTEDILLIGSHGYNPRSYIELIQHFGMETEVAQHLVHNYGT
jgi:glycerol-3-phosphate dehydrogenase